MRSVAVSGIRTEQCCETTARVASDLGYDVTFVTDATATNPIAHRDAPADRPLDELLADPRTLHCEEIIARTEYALAGRFATIRTVAELTGLTEDYVDRANLRIEHLRFFTELLRDQRRTVGRMDGRFLGWEADAAGERFTDDPSISGILGAYSAAINHYVREELDYASDLPYELLTSRVQPWSYKEFEGAAVSVVDRLGAAMRANPHLRVHVGSGYTDGATPYFAAEHVLARLAIPEELRENIDVRYYSAGHMMYVHDESRVQQSADLAAFVIDRP